MFGPVAKLVKASVLYAEDTSVRTRSGLFKSSTSEIVTKKNCKDDYGICFVTILLVELFFFFF